MVQLASLLSAIAAGSLLLGGAVAHPGEDHSGINLSKRAETLAHARRSLAGCSNQLQARGGVNERAVARRQALAEKLRAKRSIAPGSGYLKARDLTDVLNTNHSSSLTGLTANTDPSVMFSGNVSCILETEVTQGPYYVAGEYVRQDLTEDQEGVALYADVQFIDTNTCEPVPDVWIDWWHANSTGVYSGIVAGGNGNNADTANINTTFLRGIQSTDEDGVAQFTTLFPGHYTSRAPHVHILSYVDATVNDNGTISLSSGAVSHVGQIFFDQDLITAVEENAPYTTNQQELTTNENDSILAQEAADVDPVMEYVLLGETVADGLLGWVSVGIDASASYSVTPAATLTEGGGVGNPNAGGGGGGLPPGSSSSAA